MDGIFSDIRFWITCVGGIIAALIAKVVTSYDKKFDMLFKQIEKQEEKADEDKKEINKKLDDLEREINNTHMIISGHLNYHQGLKNGK